MLSSPKHDVSRLVKDGNALRCHPLNLATSRAHISEQVGEAPAILAVGTHNPRVEERLQSIRQGDPDSAPALPGRALQGNVEESDKTVCTI